MLDSNGSNTTAAAAVLTVLRHVDVGSTINVCVLGGSGPVGRRIAQLCGQMNASVTVTTRDVPRAQRIIDHLGAISSRIKPAEVLTQEQLLSAVQSADVLFAAGAAGVEMIPQSVVERLSRTKVVVDVNAVPPLGVGGIRHDDSGSERNGRRFYGAIAVGGLKMKIHRAAVQSLFESNQAILDIHEIFSVGKKSLQS